MNDLTREIVQAGVDEGTSVVREEAMSLNEQALEAIRERGLVDIIELTEEQVEEFGDTLEPIFDEYEGKIGADVYEAAREAAGN